MRLSRRKALVFCGGVSFALLVTSFSLTHARAEPFFPDVTAVQVVQRGAADTYDFYVTISSPYESASRYADAFRVKTSDGAVLGERILLHDHVDEQPFTRELMAVRIPAGIKTVIVEGRDMKSGWGGKMMAAALPGR